MFAFGFFNSAEFQSLNLNNTDFVNVLYNTIFGRNADEAGLKYWLGVLNDGLLRDFVLYGFFQSSEFSALAEQFGVTGYSERDHAQFLVKDFVRRFYVNVLGRESDRGRNGLLVRHSTEWCSQCLRYYARLLL